jgi:cephalosporin hydroxylase
LVVLDSNHTREHVLSELELYSPLVSVGSYIVAADGIMEQVVGGPRTKADWTTNNPRQAVIEFTARNNNFVVEEPKWPFNESLLDRRVTYWPDAFIKRLR